MYISFHLKIYLILPDIMGLNASILMYSMQLILRSVIIFQPACWHVQKVVLGNMKGQESGVKKNYVHVRIDISGSPLEYPGSLIFCCII